MKKLLFFAVTLTLLAGCSLIGKKPVEKLVSKTDVELTGNGFQLFRLGSDVKLVTVQNPDKSDNWMIRASVPMMKIVEAPIGEIAMDIVMLDENGMKVRDDYVLSAEDLINLIPKYNAGKDVEKNIIFSASEDSRKYYTYKEATEMLKRTKALAMNVALVQAEPELAAEPEQGKKDEPVTFSSLMEKYGVWGLLSQYDKALRNKERKKAKEIEDKLYSIEKAVKNDPTVPASVSKRFRDYIETKEDEIEDKY